MKTQINEIKRMQLLAGVINESQLNEELKVDALQSIAKEIASKNNMEFKVVDGLTQKTEDNITKILGPASKERIEKLKSTPYLVLSKYNDNAYYLFMLGNDDTMKKAWNEFGEKWESFAPGTPNQVEMYGELRHGRGIGSGTYNPETGKPTSRYNQQGYDKATDSDVEVFNSSHFIDGNAKLNTESLDHLDEIVDKVLAKLRSKK